MRLKILTRDIISKMERSKGAIVAPPRNVDIQVDVITFFLARDWIMLPGFFAGVKENLIQTLQNGRLLEGDLVESPVNK